MILRMTSAIEFFRSSKNGPIRPFLGVVKQRDRAHFRSASNSAPRHVMLRARRAVETAPNMKISPVRAVERTPKNGLTGPFLSLRKKSSSIAAVCQSRAQWRHPRKREFLEKSGFGIEAVRHRVRDCAPLLKL